MNGDVLFFDGFDCLVSFINEYFDLKKGGFLVVIFVRVGEKVQEECFKVIFNRNKIEVGNCVSIIVGNLNYSFIIYIVVCFWRYFFFKY